MKITRDVMYDLLPAYFAGEVSADTRALIEEFFTTDPEFGRMAERFRALSDERRRSSTPDTEADRERESFDRARMRVKLRHSAIVWALSALMALGIALFTPGFNVDIGLRHPGVIIGLVFAAVAVATWLVSYRADAERWYAVLHGGDEGSGEWRRRPKV
jgi:anti-sigma factor RsiW